jgi:hypothetical protein
MHAGRTASAFTHRPADLSSRRLRGLPVLVHEASKRVWGLRLRRTEQELAISPPPVLPSANAKASASLIASFRSSIPSPPVPLFTLRRAPRGAQRKTRGRVVRYSFLVGLLHSLLHAGCSENNNSSRLRSELCGLDNLH